MAPRSVRQPSNGTHTAGDYVDRVQVVDDDGSIVDFDTQTITVAGQSATAVVTQDSGGVDVTTSSTDLIASEATRKGLVIVNTGTAGVTLTLGTTATAKTGLWLAPNGGSWDGLLGTALWTGSVKGISDSGTNTCTVVSV